MARRRVVRITTLMAIGVAASAWWWCRGRRTAAATATPHFATSGPPPKTEPTPAPASWVDPVDGQCPPGYLVKLNLQSGIFHVPGGRFYDRTVPARCYASADAAEADGYRRAKA
ncbi:MAG: hypothetical protein HY828_13975 [Actinobacteria bacterium]|nr:hypothetical protein [Actinomycetota bacterium]